LTVVKVSCVRTSSIDRFLATSLAGSSWIRIAGFCWPPMNTCATPEIWLIRWASCTSTASSTSISGMLSDVAESRRIGESAGLTFR
jgi:hypothetical protein